MSLHYWKVETLDLNTAAFQDKIRAGTVCWLTQEVGLASVKFKYYFRIGWLKA